MTRILTGMQASGTPHIGNYFGMMRRAIELQHDPQNDCFYFIADLHSFTSHPDPAAFQQNLKTCVLDWLALGLDPDRSTFYRQSDIRAHSEAYWLMMCHTPMGMLERAHSFKDKVAKGLEANAGLFSYPVLMAMDILLYQAEKVPVGKDQKQHVEMARDLAQKWNFKYGETFKPLPEAMIDDAVMTIPGTDGAKMSKSYGNTIPIFAPEKVIKKAVMGIQTGSEPMGSPLNPDTCTVFALHKLFKNPDLASLKERYITGSTGYGGAKKELFGIIWDHFAPARERRAQLENDPAYVESILKRGAEKASAIAEETLSTLRQNVGLSATRII